MGILLPKDETLQLLGLSRQFNPILAWGGKFTFPSVNSKIRIEAVDTFLSFFVTLYFYLSYVLPESFIKIGLYLAEIWQFCGGMVLGSVALFWGTGQVFWHLPLFWCLFSPFKVKLKWSWDTVSKPFYPIAKCMDFPSTLSKRWRKTI